jgi:hypothetical protein
LANLVTVLPLESVLELKNGFFVVVLPYMFSVVLDVLELEPLAMLFSP